MSAELLFCVPSSWSASSLRSLLGDEANNQVRAEHLEGYGFCVEKAATTSFSLILNWP